MNNTFKLGRSIALLVPFYRHTRQKEIITNKLVIAMIGIAIKDYCLYSLANIEKENA
jgi:hypothetical protein